MLKIDTRKIMDKLILHIRKRTLSGVDTYGQTFKPYSPLYAKKKKSKPNLYLSGNMIGDMKIVDDDTFGFSKASEINKLQ